MSEKCVKIKYTERKGDEMSGVQIKLVEVPLSDNAIMIASVDTSTPVFIVPKGK